MKIEKVNDHQIRCTLTKKELEKRDLKLSEMSYGNEKVKRLFQDMMRMAAYECDFEAEDTPLMIEVIPFSECAVIIITKVEDPDELDTRFSRFAPSVHEGENPLAGIIGDVFQSLSEKNEDIAELFKKMQEHNDAGLIGQTPDAKENTDVSSAVSLFFNFTALNEVINACHMLSSIYIGGSALYKNTQKKQFILHIFDTQNTEEDFKKICTILSEYAVPSNANNFSKFYISEHCETLIAQDAITSLACI